MDAVAAEYRAGHRSVCLQLPTGGGKTATASAILARSVARGRRPLFLAHLDSLITDTHDRLRDSGLDVGVIQAGTTGRTNAAVQVCSLQTLHARGLHPTADFLIFDECHRAMATTHRAILAKYPTAHILGLTATPQRGDGQALGDVFERLVLGPTVRELTDQRHLVPAHVIAPPDVVEDGLITDPFTAYQQHAPGSRAIVFCSTVEHAKETARTFQNAGVSAVTLTGETTRTTRQQIRASLDDGGVRVLVGVGVFLEGFDWPRCETVILARSFGVTASFLQAIGRGLRPAPGKTHCTVIDLRGSVHLHGLPDEDRAWSLTGNAVRRTEQLTAVRRCARCQAMFRPARVCPRCGAVQTAENGRTIPRTLNRAEKLARLEHVPQAQRDAAYLRSLENVAMHRMRMPIGRAKAWARQQFERKRLRAASEATT